MAADLVHHRTEFLDLVVGQVVFSGIDYIDPTDLGLEISLNVDFQLWPSLRRISEVALNLCNLLVCHFGLKCKVVELPPAPYGRPPKHGTVPGPWAPVSSKRPTSPSDFRQSERLGHDSVQTTLELYGHVTPKMRANAAARFGSLLSSARTPTSARASGS
jgi:hypothetical protein